MSDDAVNIATLFHDDIGRKVAWRPSGGEEFCGTLKGGDRTAELAVVDFDHDSLPPQVDRDQNPPYILLVPAVEVFFTGPKVLSTRMPRD
jgi:hypothetical protein